MKPLQGIPFEHIIKSMTPRVLNVQFLDPLSLLPLTYCSLANWPFVLVDALKSNSVILFGSDVHRMHFTLLVRQVLSFPQVSA